MAEQEKRIKGANMELKNLMGKLPFFSKGEDEEIEIPDRLEIIFTEEAKEKGTLDDFNKEIKRYKNGIIVQREKFTSGMLIAMRKTYGLPVLDLTTSKEQDYEFEEITALEGTIKRVVRV